MIRRAFAGVALSALGCCIARRGPDVRDWEALVAYVLTGVAS